MRYTVQTEELDSVIARMARFEEDLAQAIDNADARVQQMHVNWSGEAAEQQRAAHERWQADAVRMHAALRRLRAIAQSAHANYTATVATNSAMWSGL